MLRDTAKFRDAVAKLEDYLKSKNNKEVQITFKEPGIYYYWCTPHKGMGMIGLVVVGGDTSNKDQIAKAKAIGKSKKKLKKLLSEL